MFNNWVEITRLGNQQAGVYARDQATIGRGRTSEAGVADPTQIGFTLNNRDGRFSPRNPVGPYYGQIGRNTQARVRVGDDVRGVGEVVAWPPKWTPGGEDVWVPIQAAGILRRLQQGVAPLLSPYRRFITSGAVALFANPTQPVAYWPCEDATGATSFASGLVGGRAMTFTGTPALATDATFTAGDPLPQVSNSRWSGNVVSYTPTGIIHLRFFLAVPAAGTTNGAVICRITCTGTAPRWDVVYNTGGTCTVNAYDAAVTLLVSAGPFSIGPGAGTINGVPLAFELRLEQAGSDVSYTVGTQGLADPGNHTVSGGTLAGQSVSRAIRIDIDTTGNMDTVVAGQVVVWSAVASTDLSATSSIVGFVGETAGARIFRLCAEEGIPYVRVPPSHTSMAMGAQRSGKLIDLLRECETADQGLLFEPRTFLGLAYLDRQALYNQDILGPLLGPLPAVELDYANADLSQFEPTDDDLLTVNDVTVTRTGGSSSQATLDTGTLSILDPPDGVGRYTTAVTVNVETDAQLDDQAGWRLHLGTVDEPRYPQIGVHLSRPNYTADTAARALAARVAALDVGSLVTVDNPPPWLPVGSVRQICVGFTERLSAFERTVVANCVPASPYDVGEYDGSQYSSDGSYLTAGIDSTQTAFDVTTPSGPLWMTLAEWISSGSPPFYIAVGGETMLVGDSGTTGAVSPQQFVVTRSINGVIKPHPAGTAVELATPAVYAL